MEKLRHIIEAKQFDKNLLEEIFYLTNELKTHFLKTAKKSNQYFSTNITNKELISWFYQPSTRTMASFEIAFQRMGGKVIFSTANAAQFSSAAKGETLEDTIRVICGYGPDVIILRHYETGAAKRAADIIQENNFNVHIINAGDGIGEHPTQAILDLYTIKNFFGGIHGISIAMVGDLYNGRTIRSLSYLLAKCYNYNNIKIYFVSSSIVRIKDDIKNYLKERDVWFTETDDFISVAREADVIYQTRVQKEWFGDRVDEYEKAKNEYRINLNILKEMKKDAIIMHPLPRNEEIPVYVDKDTRAIYFKQAQNGLFVRMALLNIIFS